MRTAFFTVLAIIFTLTTIGTVFADTCGLRTHTQDEWGTSSRNDNPASYRTKHFAAAFPQGARIGVETHNSALFTTSLKIQTYLPSEGNAQPLGSNTTDTTNAVGGALGGETLALLLNIMFDLENESFAPATTLLRDATLSEGPCSGMTVMEILNEGNAILAGIPSSYTAETIALCMQNINENVSLLSCSATNATSPSTSNTSQENNSEEAQSNTSTNNNSANETENVTPPLPIPQAILRIGKWYPKGTHYVFHCDTNNTSPTNYSWYFGDGEKLLQIKNQNVYHIYKKPGQYTLSCKAHAPGEMTGAQIHINVVAQ